MPLSFFCWRLRLAQTRRNMDIPIDLSDMLFACMANKLNRIPPALLNRMEVLDLGFLSEERAMLAGQ